MHRSLAPLALGLLILTACNRSQPNPTAPGGGGKGAPADAAPSAAQAKLPPDEQLRDRLDEVIQFTLDRQMKAEEQAAWQIVHGLMAYGPRLMIEADGKTVSAMDWLLGGGKLNGFLLRPADHGVQAVIEPGTKTGQGHQDQWLGYLCQCGMPVDQPIKVGDQNYTAKDLLNQAQWDCAEGMEASWTLMATSTYLPLDATWEARDGQTWSTEKLLALELATDPKLLETACGGTHRMSAIAMAVNRYKADGRELTGTWKDAQERIDWCLDRVQKFQAPDGVLSAHFFIRAGAAHELADQLHSMGHTFEFVVYALPQERLAEPWVVKAAVQLCDLLDLTRDQALECGALYHAAHGLVLYRERRFGPIEYREVEAPAETAQVQP